MKPLLTSKRAFVTGASRGLGRAICTCFAKNGAQVAFTYSRDDEGAQKTLEAISEHTEGQAFKVSVLDSKGTRQAVQKIYKTWGGIDILVNNAGITQNLPIALIDEEDWDRVMDINVKGTFLTTHEVLRGMIRNKAGIILNIGSVAGMRLIDAPVHYCASKAAIAGFTMALSKQVARHSIRVNCLAPGLLDDGVGKNLPEHRLEDYLHHCSLSRVGTIDEVASYAAFLVSDENSYMNGEVVLMDGGL